MEDVGLRSVRTFDPERPVTLGRGRRVGICLPGPPAAFPLEAAERPSCLSPATIEKEMRKLFNIPAERETRLWNKYMSNTYEQLSKLDNTVQDAGLYQGQVGGPGLPSRRLSRGEGARHLLVLSMSEGRWFAHSTCGSPFLSGASH